MKTLVLVRHGKASRCYSGQEEIDRSLAHKGKKDVEHMSEMVHDFGLHVHAVISSPAVCAETSAKYFADRAVLPVAVDKRLYNAMAKGLLEFVRGLDRTWETVVLVGHNPGFSDFLRKMLDYEHSDLSCGAIAIINFNVPEWTDITDGSGYLDCFLSPETVKEFRRAA